MTVWAKSEVERVRYEKKKRERDREGRKKSKIGRGKLKTVKEGSGIKWWDD